MTLPNLGYQEIQYILDFNQKVITQYLPQLDICSKYDISTTRINLQKMFSDYANPESGKLEHIGNQSVAWSGAESYAVKIKPYPVKYSVFS